MRKEVKSVIVQHLDGTFEEFLPDEGKTMHLVVLDNNHINSGVISDRFVDYSINWTKSKG